MPITALRPAVFSRLVSHVSLVSFVSVAALTAFAGGCKSGAAPEPATQDGASSKKQTQAGPTTTKVTAFAVDLESLNVDKISMRDGVIRPDGNRDFAFTASVDGPANALYLVTVSEKGEPHYGFRADTIVGHEEIPAELGSVVDTGRLTVWMAVVEHGKFINEEDGTLGTLPAGTHSLKLYVPNTGNLAPGAHLRLYARAPSGALVPGPIVRY